MVRAMVLAACVVALAGLAAAPASAIIVKLPSGKMLSYEALAGKSPQQLQRRPHDAALSNLDYSGGPVMPSSTNYVIDWEPSNYAGTPNPGAGSQGFVFGVAQFFKDLSAVNGVTTNSDSISTQYNDTSGNTAAYNTQLASGGTGANGAYLDTDPLPSNGCSEGAYCITDQQLQDELASYISARGLPSGDLTHEYFVLTPPDVVSCFDQAGTQCSGNAPDSASEAFCGYHSASTTATLVLYANIPDMDGINGCDPFATVSPCDFDVCDYNSTFAEGVLSTVSHEHNESITDPLPNTAWTDYQQCSQGDPETCGGEVGDKCSGDEGLDPNFTFLTGSGFIVPRNEQIGSDHYWLQMEWSNQGAGCADSLSALGGLSSPPGASFAVKGDQTTANTDLFDATGSGAGIAHYVWQFTDADGGTQNTTVETTSPAITHTFPAAGSYIVALTTMAANGRSLGTAKQTIAAGLSQAGFSVAAPSLLEGSLVSFSAASTTHDASVPISAYSWNFGDGSAPGTGVTIAHTFRAGAHTVTLVVTDALGRVSAASTTLRVADRPPTASFKAQSGKAGSKLTFTGHGADDEAISYRWKFGDGGSARGAKVKHAFKRKGRYRVTLKVTDASGLSVSVTHVVKITAPRRRR
jgi:chitodextrinase